jgi:YidC/Oxa1 family membrane protein insertase
MEKRIFTAVVISIAVLFIWSGLIVPKYFPQLVKKPVPAQEQTQTVPPGTAPRGATATTTAVPVAGSPAVSSHPVTAPVIVPVAGAALQTTTVETTDFIAQFSNRGAQLVSFRLKHYKTPSGDLVELVKARPPSRADFPFAVETTDPALAARLNNALYQVTDRVEKGLRVIEYRYAEAGVSATKTFRVGNEYQFDFAVAITPPVRYRVAIGPGIRTLGADEKDTQIVVTGNGVVQRNDKLTVIRREKADAFDIFTDLQFIGIEDNYFLAVIRPTTADGGVMRRIEVPVEGSKDKRRELYAAVNATSSGIVAGTTFWGPKQVKIAEKYGYDSTLQFGYFGFIGRILLEVLIWINHTTKNYGFAIILLTIVIKIVLYPLQHKSIVSMKRMQRVQPKVEAIKKRYKSSRTDVEQRNKMNAEMMKLYQQEGINPMGGCLPIVLQLPILWGFYGLLSRAIELRGAPFIFWIHDLSARDPYYITPILMTVTMFIQQAMTPTTADPAQKRMFLVMPLVFGFIFKDFPSGLVLYWLVQNVLTIVQQSIMNKWWKDHPAELKKD